ncbi:helix-turn-helix domain-containing protein [Lutibacter sp. B2]|nr:helix-turn-helix domain-containing protein [Lutibacter sp. B2]
MIKWEVINAVYKSDLTKRATLVVFYLINRANKEMTCFPGVKTIAKECNMSTRTVQRALNDIVETGFLKKESRFHKQGGQRSNLYTLTIVEKDCDNPPNDTVTFNSYVNDKVDNKKEESVEEIESNNEDISSKGFS